ncbi:hypothetical protein [Nostoc sp. UHCC 0251]|uniref:hypothetical protein n=1 Tax=Nostoc sp. UHCC 0251 TaxID=3110240 RepID=UPI002B1F04DF|nr:hypothetical protein [Nostoc sp. UHCC 0251]MEA5627471.1 hypothetical protein [Nostoc sp. UHCC 0251]
MDFRLTAPIKRCNLGIEELTILDLFRTPGTGLEPKNQFQNPKSLNFFPCKNYHGDRLCILAKLLKSLILVVRIEVMKYLLG